MLDVLDLMCARARARVPLTNASAGWLDLLSPSSWSEVCASPADHKIKLSLPCCWRAARSARSANGHRLREGPARFDSNSVVAAGDTAV